MEKNQLPKISADEALQSLQYRIPEVCSKRWNKDVRAKDSGGNSIDIYDAIGESWDGSGITPKKISSALQSIKGDVVVNINSPGGSFFDGITIYNMLREHDAKVTVRIMGIAASAASVIAMAADEIQIAEAGFLMIHNSWVVALGNRHDLVKAAEGLEPFDKAMLSLYAKRSGYDKDKIQTMMDDETWISGSDAVDIGFADGFLPGDEVVEETEAKAALRKIDNALAKDGMSRNERRALIKEITGKPSAANDATPSADINVKALEELLDSLKT